MKYMIEYIFISTSTIYSGHERLFFKAAIGISKNSKSIFIVNRKNRNGISVLRANGAFSNIIELDFGNDFFESCRVWFRWLSVLKLIKIFLKEKPKKIVVGQGRIEGGAVATLAAKLINLQCYSYIPMAHSHAEMSGNGFLSKIKDFLSNRLYKLPSSYIAISEAVKKDIEEKVNNKNISIVENYTSLKPIENKRKLLDRKINILILGRISFRHKCQDVLIKTIYENLNLFNNNEIHFNIVGDGPDVIKLTEMISKYKLNNIVTVLGHTSNVIDTINENDILFLPSKYEGVPLTMIEAAKCKKMILGSNINGISEYLNDEYLFNSILEGIQKIKLNNFFTNNYTEKLNLLVERTEAEFIMEFEVEISK